MSSKEIDERVVEMRFDNKNFESNVKDTITSVDKLNKSLKFDGATKGLENIASETKKISFDGLSRGVDAVKVKFSALEVMAVTALANITNSAVNAGKRLLSSLTIDPIKTGLSEYETQINAVQTILANTSSKGTTIDQVNDALDQLNTYADKTIYNFTEMTRNIGTFTAAGVDLDTSVSAIQGIANVAAVSGSTAQQASTAMYQLSQALATGTVKLQDWNSVVNAGMGGEVFQKALIRTSNILGTGADNAIKRSGSFRDSLTKSGWLTTKVLTETLDQFTMLDNEANRATLSAKGYSTAQIDEILKMGETATDAATKVKTFTQLIDTLQEAAQSGWGQTWRLLIGDFEEAKTLFTEASDFFGSAIGNSANARNKLLSGALNNAVSLTDWDQLKEAGVATKDLQNALINVAESHGIAVKQMVKDEGSFKATLKNGWLSLDILKETLTSANGSIADSTGEMSKNLSKFESLAKEVIGGKWGNGEARKKSLADAGHDYATVQKIVNSMVKGTKLELDDLSKAELKSMGYTTEQIKSLQELAKSADKAGTPIGELMKKLERPTGRELIIDTIRNSIKAMAKVVTSINGAWRDVFPKTTSEQLYNLIDGIHNLSEMLIMSDGNADKLKRTLRGLFAIFDIIRIVVGGTLSVAFTIFKEILAAMDMNVLDVTANVGDAIYAFRNWFKANNVVTKGIQLLIKGVKIAVIAISDWIKRLKEIPKVKNNITKFSKVFSSTMGSMYKHLGDVLDRLLLFIERVKSMESLSLSDIGDILKDFKDNVLDYVFDIDGAFDNLKNAFTSLKSSITDSLENSDDAMSRFMRSVIGFASGVKDKLGGVDLGAILAIAVGVGMIKAMKKVAGAITGFTNPLEALGGVFEALSGKFKADSMEKKAGAVLKMATAIAVLAGALYVISKIDKDRLWSSVAAIAALGAALLIFAKVNSMTGKSLKSAVSAGTIVALSLSLLIMIKALKKLDDIDTQHMQKNILYLGELALGLIATSVIIGKAGGSLGKSSLTMVGVAYAIRTLVTSLSKLDGLNLQNGNKSMMLLIGMMSSLAIMSKVAGGMSFGAGVGILAIAVSLKVLIGAFRQLNKMDSSEIQKGMDALTSVMVSFSILLVASKFAGGNAAKAGTLILAMSFSLLLIASACKKLSKLDQSGLKQATKTIATITAIFGGVIALSNLAGSNAAKAGTMLVLMSGAFLALTITMTILSKLDPDGLDRAVDAITQISICFALLIGVTKLATDVKGTLIALATTIGILSIALGALSLIEPSKLQSATKGLTTVILAFSILVASTKLAQSATATLAILTGAVLALGGVLYLVGQLPVESSLGAAASLSVLMLTLSGVMLIISRTSTVSPKALLALGAMTLVMTLTAGILAIMTAMNVDVSIKNATAMSILLLALSSACLILSAVGKGAGAAIKGALALDAVIIVIGALMVGIGALFENVNGMDAFLDKGIEVLSKIGYGLGKAVGSLAGGLSDGVMSGLPAIGAYLSEFMNNAEAFFTKIKMVDGTTTESALNLAAVLAVLTGAQLLKGITSFVFGDTTMDDFGKDLATFGTAIVGFSNIVKGRIDGESVTAASNAGKTLAAFSSTIPNSGGLLGKVLGENDLDDFASKLGSFATAIVNFSAIVKGRVDGDSVTVASNAGKTLAELANALPNAGGFISKIVGENDMKLFSENLGSFATAIVNFSAIVKGKVDETAIKTAANAGGVLVELAKTLPRTGGAVQWITGQQDLGKFGSQLSSFGLAIVGFSRIVKGNVDTSAITNAANAGGVAVELANTLPKADGVVQWFSGNKDIAAFGAKLVLFGQSMVDFSDTVTGNINESAVATASNTGKMLMALSESLPDKDGPLSFLTGSGKQSMSSFGGQLVLFGDYMAQFSDSIKNVNDSKMTSVTSSLESVVDLANKVEGVNTKNFGAVLATLAHTGVTSFLNGFKESTDDVKITVDAFVASAIQAFTTNILKFYTSGQNGVIGFVNGIESKIKDGTVYSAGRRIGEVALQAAKNALDIHSPSKAMYKVGSFTIDGFVNALTAGKTTVSKAAKSMFEGFVKQATKTSTVSKYTKGMVSQYAKTYVSASKSTTKQTAIATKAVSAYVNKLYLESDAYKQNEANIKTHTKELQALQKQRAAVTKSMSNKKNSKSTNASLKKQLADIDKQIKAAKKQLVTDGEDVAKNAKAVLKEIKDSIKDNVKDYLNLFNVSLDTGIDMFAKTANTLKSALIDYADALGVAYDAGVDIFEEFNANGATKQQADDIASAEERLTAINDTLTQAQEELNAAQEKSNAVNGRSQVLLDEVAEAQARVTAAIEAQAEAQKALTEAKTDTSVNDTLSNMESQIKGIEELQNNLKLLGERGINDGLLKHLKELGVSGADQVATFVKMTDAELQKANTLFAKSSTLNATTLIDNFKNKITDMSNWNMDMQAFSKLKLGTNVKAALMQDFQEQGVESSEYLKTILAMTEEQLAEFNATYKKYLTVPGEVADEVSKTTNKIVNKSTLDTKTAIKETLESMQSNVDGYKDWQKDLSTLSKTGMSDELLASLANLGIDGAEQVKVFTQMTAAELKKANQLFKESGTMAGQTLLDNFGAKLNSAKDWGDNVKKIADLNLSANVKEALLKEIQEQGVSSADYVNSILAMNKSQLKEFNSQYKEYLTIPNTVANEVLAAQASVNTEVAKSTKDTATKVTAAVKASTDAAKTTAKTEGKKIGTATADAITSGLVKGITSGSKEITSTSKTTGNDALDGFKTYLSKSKGKGVGTNVVNGMIKGIADNTESLKIAAENAAKVALTATNKVLGIHSPSKKYEEVGKFSMLGMANGLLNYSKNVKDAAVTVGGSAINAMSNTISKLAQLTTDNLDAQPTIRPVLDLSEVKSGFGNINSMFGSNTIGIKSNEIASNISTRMNRSAQNQNGVSSNDSYDNSQLKVENTFYVTGSDPKAIATEVSQIMQRQYQRKDAIWGT